MKGRSGLLQKQDKKKNKQMKHKVMPKKNLTSKVLDMHLYACAYVQSDQGLWVFAVEKRLKDLHEIRDGVQENI